VPQLRSATGGGDLGIGLALSRQLINLHGGSIEAKSDGLGLGSKFIVRLPLQQQVAVENFSKEVGVPNCGSQRILIVDDNRDAAESMSALLELKGHAVQTAYDGVEAIKAVEVFAPEVVLLDIGLPNMDGYEVARRIRAMRSGKEVLLFALTGWGQESDKEQTRAAGFDEHLTKPVNAALISTLIAAQAGRRHRPGDPVDDMSALN
jgi:CheY-like chemotaxis protein